MTNSVRLTLTDGTVFRGHERSRYSTSTSRSFDSLHGSHSRRIRVADIADEAPLFTGITGKVDQRVLKLAMQIERKLWEGYQWYLDMCEYDRSQGHTPRSCEHGTDRWVDYDNICGPCEDGITMRDGAMRRTMALSRARKAYREIDAIFAAYETLSKAGVKLTPEQAKDMMTQIEWLQENA